MPNSGVGVEGGAESYQDVSCDADVQEHEELRQKSPLSNVSVINDLIKLTGLQYLIES